MGKAIRRSGICSSAVAYLVAGTPLVLPAISIGVASAAILLLVLRSPFSWWMIALIVLSEFALFEYSVMARNYGISALLLFVLAALYKQHRDRGILLGVLLALLANTNAHSVVARWGLFALLADRHSVRTGHSLDASTPDILA